MFEAMRQAAFLHKLIERRPDRRCRRRRCSRWRRSAARARWAWRDRLGSLEPGKLADLIVVSMQSARQTPLYNPVSHLVYVTRGDDVRTTIVNGRVADAGPARADARRRPPCWRDAREAGRRRCQAAVRTRRGAGQSSAAR